MWGVSSRSRFGEKRSRQHIAEFTARTWPRMWPILRRSSFNRGICRGAGIVLIYACADGLIGVVALPEARIDIFGSVGTHARNRLVDLRELRRISAVAGLTGEGGEFEVNVLGTVAGIWVIGQELRTTFAVLRMDGVSVRLASRTIPIRQHPLLCPSRRSNPDQERWNRTSV